MEMMPATPGAEDGDNGRVHQDEAVHRKIGDAIFPNGITISQMCICTNVLCTGSKTRHVLYQLRYNVDGPLAKHAPG